MRQKLEGETVVRTLDDVITEIRRETTVNCEVAARALGTSRGKAYELARTGQLAPGIPVIRVGSSLRVPTAPLRRALGLEPAQGGEAA